MSVEVALDKLNQLKTLQSNLKQSLTTKGLICSDDAEYPELVSLIPTIDHIPYAIEGKRVFVSTQSTMVIPNIPKKPVEFGLICQSLRNTIVHTAEPGFILTDLLIMFPDNQDVYTVDNVTVTRTQDVSTGTWTLTVTSTDNTSFLAGYEYTWIIFTRQAVFI